MVRFVFHIALSVPKADVKEGNVLKASKTFSLKTKRPILKGKAMVFTRVEEDLN